MRSQIGAEALDVILGGVQIHHAAMNSGSRNDLHPEAAPKLLTETENLAGDFHPRQHRPTNIVSWACGVTENRQQPIAFRRSDVPVVVVDNAQHLLAVSPDNGVICLWLDLGRQQRRVDEIGEKYCQTANLTASVGSGEQILRFGVAFIGNQDLLRQRRCGYPIATVDRRHRRVQQVIDRGAATNAGAVIPRDSPCAVAHVKYGAITRELEFRSYAAAAAQASS